MTGSSRTTRLGVAVVVLVLGVWADPATGDEPVLRLRAAVVGAPTGAPLVIELLRWSTDAERAPLVTALSAPPPAPPAPPEAATARGGRGGAGRAGGRGGRGGRGAAPPASPAARLSAAVKAAPTVGFIWGDGPTGYSIKYAWRSASPDGTERFVLVTDRRLGAHTPSWPQVPGAAAEASAKADAAVEAEFTVIEIRVDAKGAGEGKSSLSVGVGVDAQAKTLALEGYATAPALLKVTR